MSKTTVTSGGVLELFGGATASATTVKSGGTLEIEGGYALSGFTVSNRTIANAKTAPPIARCQAFVQDYRRLKKGI